MNPYRSAFGEIHLKIGQWQNIPEAANPWRAYNSDASGTAVREKILDAVMPLLQSIIQFELTGRQREIMIMYFQERKTQVQIGKALGISQPVVSQHLAGKKRRGRKVGGALLKIRKCIRRKAREGCIQNTINSVRILDKLLDKTTTRRRAEKLIRQLIR